MIKPIIFFLLFYSSLFSQWETGAYYSIKSELPGKGFGINVSRNLPFQWPGFGLKIRAEGDFFSDITSLKIEGYTVVPRVRQKDLHFDLICTFYPRYFQPYSGLGCGLSFFSYSARNYILEQFYNTTSNKEWFFLEIPAGIRFCFIKNLYPFAEFHLIKYFSNFTKRGIIMDIPSLQFYGCFGLQILINDE